MQKRPNLRTRHLHIKHNYMLESTLRTNTTWIVDLAWHIKTSPAQYLRTRR